MKNNYLFLLSFPIGLFGIVQVVFAILSFELFNDNVDFAFFVPGLALLVLSLSGLFLHRNYDSSKIKFRQALLFAVMTWVVCGLIGSFPIILVTGCSITDGVFESVSGLTTTGATILTGLDSLPATFLLYRQFLQWLGGLGVVVFVVAILPMLNVGGMKLLKCETPGPMKDTKLTPRVTRTAHYLWLVYALLTILCVAAYYFAGMTLYEAVAHAFTTISTGGFSIYDASMGHFDNPWILIVSDVFMLLGAVSFALHFNVWRRRRIILYFKDEETRIFLYIVFSFSVLIALFLIAEGVYAGLFHSVNEAVFHLISFITSTGYVTPSLAGWPAYLSLLLLIAGYLGGCAGSTAGGNKIIRNIITSKLMWRELKYLNHASGTFLIKFNRRLVDNDVLEATMSFMFVVLVVSVLGTLLLMATGLDFWSSITAVGACINVLGPAFGELGNNFQPVSDAGTWLLSFLMILGRLEYFSVLSLFLPMFWRI